MVRSPGAAVLLIDVINNFDFPGSEQLTRAAEKAPLDLLLEHLRVRTLVITGFATNLCVLFTANDAHMRGYHLVVPRDCTASNTPRLTQATLHHVRVALSGSVPLGRAVDFDALRTLQKKARGQSF